MSEQKQHKIRYYDLMIEERAETEDKKANRITIVLLINKEKQPGAMALVKFLKLNSQKKLEEQKKISVDFSSPDTVIIAGDDSYVINGFPQEAIDWIQSKKGQPVEFFINAMQNKEKLLSFKVKVS